MRGGGGLMLHGGVSARVGEAALIELERIGPTPVSVRAARAAHREDAVRGVAATAPVAPPVAPSLEVRPGLTG